MSSSSLYGYNGNVTVSANNLTTLYSSQPGNVVVANVADRNFTTLYTKQSDITPTRAYGNANVEAFLNAGTDGANSVQSIHMSGTLTVGGQSNLGPVGNVHITGGSPGYVIATNGYGELIWTENGGSDGNIVPYIHFDVTSSGNNQQFTSTNLQYYEDENYFSLFKNGVNIEPFYYEKTGNTTVQVNIPLAIDDTIDILPSAGGSGGSGTPGGSVGMVQFNTGYDFGGDSGFLYDTTNTLATITNIDVAETATFSNVGNVHISGGTANQFLKTDGAGNLSWADSTVPGGSNTYVQFNDSGSFNGDSAFTYNASTDTLSVVNLDVDSIDSLGSGVEKVILATGVSGTYTFNSNTGATSNSIVLVNDNATANFQIDFTNLSLSTSTCRTFTYINHNGVGNTYVCTGVKIEGTTQTVNWLGGTAPTIGNTYDVYTFNFFKTGSSTYVILGAKGGF